MSAPNASPAYRVNRSMYAHALPSANRSRNADVKMHTHALHAMKSPGPRSARSFAKSNMYLYTSTMGSATPTMSSGWPPATDCIVPVMAHAASTWTTLITSSVSDWNWMPNASAGITDAKKMKVAAAATRSLFLPIDAQSSS